MRHRIVHDYVNIRLNIVWEVLANDLQPLIESLEVFIPDPEDC
jgi:uncharacterized protein with HEPN domain